jgi:hypothetical protein
LSEFTSEFELFTSVVDPGVTDWSSPDNALIDSELQNTTTWDQNGTLEFTLPKIAIPGGRPLLPTIVINDLQMQIRWARGGNENSGGIVYLRNFSIGGGVLDPNTKNFSSTNVLEPVHTNQLGGDAAYWECTQPQIVGFMNGDTPLTVNIDTSSINGSTQTKIAWVKMQAQYTYTGSGIAFPRLF